MTNNQTSKTFDKKVEKMTLGSYYEGLPKRICPKTEFITEVMQKTGKSYVTVVNWVKGKCKPEDEADIEVLSNLTGISAENLW